MSKITVIRENEEREIEESLLKRYEMEGFRALASEPSKVVETTNLNELTLKDLRAIAKERGFVGYSEMKKEQLIELLEKDDE